MTEPARERRTSEISTPSSKTRVVKGKYTIEMNPKPNRSMKATTAVFANWLSTHPHQISALFASVPTAFEGMKEEIAEIKRRSMNPRLRPVENRET